MKLDIKGGSKSQRAILSDMTPFILDKLLGRLANTVEIVFQFITTRITFAATSPETGIRRPKHFHIVIARNLKVTELRQTLIHELVHVKQYRKGELYDYCRDDTIEWQGKKYPASSDEGMDYFIAPWEREANGYEYGLLVHYKAHQRSLRRK